MASKWAIGLMTGTVLDGMIDIAAIRTDGVAVEELGPWTLSPYASGVRRLLARVLPAARAWRFEGPDPAVFAEAEEALTRAQSHAVAQFMAEHGIRRDEVAVIGFHGQTVLHVAPQDGRRGATRQLGDGQLMSDILGVDTVYDFRRADVLAGGHGAPLAATYHAALLRRMGASVETAILNLGGVGNITWWDGADRLVAFDTGPANAPLNDWVRRFGAGDMDTDGMFAHSGQADEHRITRLLEHPYFAAPSPKSLDRDDFTAEMSDGLSLEDGAATITALIASTVGCALTQLPSRPTRLVVCGGGRRNPALMQAIVDRAHVEVLSCDEVGLRGDAVEAECFAFLAVRAAKGLPISFPTTTGVPQPMSGGVIAGPRLSIALQN